MNFRQIINFLVCRKFNFFATLYINLKLFSFRTAIKMPILIYGKWHFLDLSGTIEFSSPIRRGMLTLGENRAGYVVTGRGSIRLVKGSKIILRGMVMVSQGVHVYLGRNALLDLEDGVKFGDSVKIICYKRIVIGKLSGITWESQITDYNSHYIEDVNTRKISVIQKSVVIGNNCWIGNRTSIMPGTVLPDWTIVGSNSLLNKNYKSLGLNSYSLIAGVPAKLIGTGYKRIYDREFEKRLHKYFNENKVEYVNSDEFSQ